MALDAQPTEEQAVGPLGYEPPQPKEKKHDEEEPSESRKAFVKQWQERIRKDKSKWEPDFKDMRLAMDFVANYQYKNQRKKLDDQYIANWTIRTINQKVATLYARNPTVAATRRKRMDFEMWDENPASIMQALATGMGSMQTMGILPPEVLALMNDYGRGRFEQGLVKKVGQTLETVFQYQLDTQQPNFKTQAKQWVHRACVCGVGYIKVNFCRDYEHNDLTQSETRQSTAERVQRAKLIIEKIEKGDIDMDDAQVEILKNLVASLSLDPTDSENVSIKERLVFDFPPATAIIPDSRCRCLKGFIGAHYITEEFFMPLDVVNAMYELSIKPGGDLKEYDSAGKPMERNIKDGEKDNPVVKPTVCLWQTYDLDTKNTWILCDGHKDFVMEPEVLTPATKSFWTIFPLVFNSVETEPGCKASVFPLGDVQLLMPMQKEWNRTRQSLRGQRKANAPKYMCPKGTLTQNDIDNIQDAEENQVVELEGLPKGTEPGKIIQPLQVARIDPAVYDTKPLQEDALLATGQQEANTGPAQPNVTATVGSIAEQSRMTVAASNVDDLDDCLSDAVGCGGEMLLHKDGMSQDTVKHIAGRGAVWPEQNREDFLNEIVLTVRAASSGRPNKAIAIDNWTKLMPLILQAAQMPPQLQPTVQACIKESIKRLDEPDLDPQDFFPLPAGPPQPGAEGGESTPAGSPPPSRKMKRANARGEGQMHPSGAAPVPQPQQ